MNFEERFELGALVRDDGIRTYAAKDKSSGQELLAHFFSSAAEAADLAAALNRLPERERQRIVARGESGGVAYVVTGSLPGFAGFREWLAENGRAPRSLDAAGAWKVILPERNVDEQFLALFPTGERVQATPEPAPSPAAAPMGEFTRMFQASPPAPHPAAPPPPAPAQARPAAAQPPLPAPAPAPAAPGEFTRMFQAQSAPSPAPAPPSKAPEGPGEFTRFFDARVHESRVPEPQAHPPRVPSQPFPSAVPPNLVPAPSPAAPSQRAPSQGEFTKVFGRGEIRSQVPAAPPDPAPPLSPPPAAPTRLFEPLPAAANPPAQQGPGDYTRRFSATPALTLGQASETPAPARVSFSPDAAPAAPARSGRALPWYLILGIAAIVVLLAVVILFVVARAK